MPTPRFIQLVAPDSADLVLEAATGLASRPAHIAPKFFYDELGSRLFDAITVLPEYTPTRTEAGIFAAHAAAIGQALRAAVGERYALVDLGAGNCEKAGRLFPALRPARYIAVDFSAEYLRRAIDALQQRHPAIEMVALGADFSAQFLLPEVLREMPLAAFFPGSSIGNFQPDDALRLLAEVRATCRALVIGVDLVKDRRTLELAYDDPLGVTAAFNLNVLRHLNRLLGADFAPQDWAHVALFDPAASRIRMFLQARRELTVRWPRGERHFAAGERIHTEDSYKWRREDFQAVLHDAGFRRVQSWQDAGAGFAVMLAA